MRAKNLIGNWSNQKQLYERKGKTMGMTKEQKNEHGIKYRKRFGALLEGFIQAISELVVENDPRGIIFLVDNVTSLADHSFKLLGNKK
jgi:hypothetical protein